jgi:hypothetical protein
MTQPRVEKPPSRKRLLAKRIHRDDARCSVHVADALLNYGDSALNFARKNHPQVD